MSSVEPKPVGSGGWIRRLSPFLLAHRRNVIIAFGAAVVGQARHRPSRRSIEKVDHRRRHRRPHDSRSGRAWCCCSSAGVISFSAAYIRRWVGGRVSLDVQYDLRNAIYERLQRLDFAGHDQLQTGQLVSRGVVRPRADAGAARRSCRSCSATS